MNKIAHSFKKKQSVEIRIWHWVNFLAISGLMLTGLLRKNWMNSKANAEIIVQKSTELGTPLTPEMSREIAIAIRNPMWDWHYVAGFILAACLLFRVYIFIKNRKNVSDTDKINLKDKSRLHKNLVQIGYSVFYSVTFYMVVSGLLMYFKKELNLPKDLAGNLKEIHELLIWFFGLFITSHIIGVILIELRGDKGIISDMINGGE